MQTLKASLCPQLILLSFLFLLSSGILSGRATAQSVDNGAIKLSNDSRNSVEGSVLLPFFPGNELLLKYTRTIWKQPKTRGELVTGIHFHIQTERDGGIYDDYQVVLAYRQFLWKGLHVEAGVEPKFYYRMEEATYSDRKHEGYGLFTYTMAGYQIEAVNRDNYSFFINVQPVGVALSVFHSDNWAKDAEGNEEDDLLYFGNIALGIRF